MLTSPNPPGPPASLPPTRRFGRRLNRVPAVIAVAIMCIIAAAVSYTLYEKSQDELRRRQHLQATPSGADASGTLKDAPNGWIPPTNIKKEAVNLSMPPAPRADQPAPGQRPPEVTESDDNGREKQRKAAWLTYWNERKELHDSRFKQRQEALLALKTSVESGGHSGAETPAMAPAPAEAQQSTPSYTGAHNGWGGGGSPSMAGLWGGGGFGGYPGLATPQIDREGQEQKLRFAGQQGDLGKNDVVPTVRKPPDPYALMAGSFVKLSTLNEVNSDIPGTWVAKVTESAYNTSDGTCVLIPSGSTMVGRYNSVVSTGQSRLPGSLTRIIFPDGSSQAMGSMEMADNAGSAGMEDQINRHLLQKFGSAAIAGLFGASIQLAFPHNGTPGGYDSTQILAASIGQQMGQLGQQIALQNLSIPNTLTVRAGANGTMITDKDLHITPWSCNGHRSASVLPIMPISGQ